MKLAKEVRQALTHLPAFADAVHRAQRRHMGVAPGTGQLGDDCGRCGRILVRCEVGPRGGVDLRYECAACDRLPRMAKSRGPGRLRQGDQARYRSV
ncbi:hypothetical protein BJ992_004261 [Sphaerisporangium rubeum]|uniref:Uncharacterized protein n=1 Tax=Sphaerisporangium rubeum TaxID=321317 RepID=A0A7X0M7R4_9ACTN|nr:hypothetical protein [Sphaerisporangium rubeum]